MIRKYFFFKIFFNPTIYLLEELFLIVYAKYKPSNRMWKSTAGHIIGNSNPLSKKMIAENNNDPDDWDTDPDFIVRIFLIFF